LKRIILSCACLLLLVGPSRAKDIPLDVQQTIIEDFMAVTGRGDRSQVKSLQSELTDELDRPLKCGTSAILDYVLNLKDLDKGLLKEMSAADLVDRYVLSDSLASPSGNFLIHYTRTGSDAVYQPNNVNGSGVPLFVVKVAEICDSVFFRDIFDLGYSPPPADGFYPEGGDNKFDVYLRNLNGSGFGLTYLDSAYIDGLGTTRGTAFIELDNDYAEIPIYSSRPLDAVRVTVAHEYFHAIQFGIDFTEAEDYNDPILPQRYWMEMSATWMEEEHYDHINDYYYYLPNFFDKPNESLQAFRSTTDLHPYASVVYPLYLSERFNKDVIREIWTKCSRSIGPDFLLAAAEVIDSVSNGTASFVSTFGEFAIWNYFTRADVRANLAPPGIGYSEKAFYPAIPDSMIAVIQSYPAFKAATANKLNPFHNAAFYMKLESLESIVYRDRFWVCTDTSWETCTDSIEVLDTLTVNYQFMSFDTSWWQCNTWVGGVVCIDSTELPDESGSNFFHVDTTYWRCTDGTNLICFDSSRVTDTTLGYEWSTIDSSLRLYDCLDPSYRQPWGLGIILQDAVNPDSINVGRYVIPPPPESAKKCDSIDLYHPRQYRSATFIFAPGSPFRENFSYNDPITFGYFVDEVGDTATEYANLAPAVMTPYPNPAVLSEMESDSIFFKFQLPTDSAGFRAIDTGFVLIDIFTVAGDKVRSLKVTKFDPISNFPRGELIFGWDIKNAHGSKVASGVYLVYARLHAGILRTVVAPGGGTVDEVSRGDILAEAKTKVAIIK
jgi:hypothetical protein